MFIRMVGQGTVPDVTLAVLAHRSMATWRDDMIKRAAAMPASEDVFTGLANMEAAGTSALASFWPSERTAFANAVVGARTRLAGPALKAQVDRLFASAQGLAGAHQIARVLASAQWAGARRSQGGAAAGGGTEAREIGNLLAMVTPEMAATEKARLEARLTTLIAAEAAGDRAGLASLGAGLPAFEKGSQWYGSVVGRYGALVYQPPVQELLAELGRKRAEPLRASEATLSQRINAAPGTDAVNGVIGQYLSVPSDRQDPTGGRLHQLAAGRGESLRQGVDGGGRLSG